MLQYLSVTAHWIPTLCFCRWGLLLSLSGLQQLAFSLGKVKLLHSAIKQKFVIIILNFAVIITLNSSNLCVKKIPSLNISSFLLNCAIVTPTRAVSPEYGCLKLTTSRYFFTRATSACRHPSSSEWPLNSCWSLSWSSRVGATSIALFEWQLTRVGSAPCARSSEQTSTRDLEAASCKGVNCHRSIAFTLAPAWKFFKR